MAFCEFSSEVISKNSVSIENQFITDFLPNAEGDYVKVYLYGLYLCGTSKDNSIDVFEKNLGLTREDILSIFFTFLPSSLLFHHFCLFFLFLFLSFSHSRSISPFPSLFPPILSLSLCSLSAHGKDVKERKTNK